MDRTETGCVPAADPETMPRKRARRRKAAAGASMDGDAAAANLAAYLNTVEAAAATLIRRSPDDRPIALLALAGLLGLHGFPEGARHRVRGMPGRSCASPRSSPRSRAAPT